jgi:hypothetical protein
MATPNKHQIVEKAIELFHNERARRGDPSFPITPTEQELKENGFWSAAVSELMRDQYRSQIESKDFFEENLEEDFEFDSELGLQRGAFIAGNRGCAKSNLAKKIVDVFLRKGYVIRVFDNSQTWRDSSVPNLVLVTPRSNFESKYEESYVFDTSLLDIGEQKTFIENVADREFIQTATLSENERTWRIYVFEECELLLGTHDNSKKIMRLCASGRNLKMSYVSIAQRFQMVTTNLVSLSGQLYIGAMHEQNDLKKIRNWLADKTKELQNLEVGEFFRYCNGKSVKMRTERFRARSQPKTILAETNITPIMKPQPMQSNQTLGITLARLGMIALFTVLLLGAMR